MSVPAFARAISSYVLQNEHFFHMFRKTKGGLDICAYLAFYLSAIMSSYL